MLKVFLIDHRGRVREIYSLAYLQPQVMLNDIRTLHLERRSGFAGAGTAVPPAHGLIPHSRAPRPVAAGATLTRDLFSPAYWYFSRGSSAASSSPAICDL